LLFLVSSTNDGLELVFLREQISDHPPRPSARGACLSGGQ